MSAEKPKQERQMDRHSGTGRPIKGENVREGSGKGNWGSNQEQIEQGIASVEEEKSGNKQQKRRKNDEPESMGDLNEEAVDIANQKVFDDFLKDSGRSLASPYNNKEVKSGYQCKQMKLKKSQKETDKLFHCGQKKKPKKKQKKKQKMVLGNLSFTFASDEPQGQDEGYGYGRGRGGRGRGRGMNQGFDNRGGRGFGARGRGMGFGRGRANAPRGPMDEQGVPQQQGANDQAFNYDDANANARNFVNADQDVPVNGMPQAAIQEQQA